MYHVKGYNHLLSITLHSELKEHCDILIFHKYAVIYFRYKTVKSVGPTLS